MASGLKFDMAKPLVWTTEKPYLNDSRTSPAFLLYNQLSTFYLVVDNYSRYSLKILDENDEEISILLCGVSVCILDESERNEYLKEYSSVSEEFYNLLWSYDHFQITNHLSDFHLQPFMRFKITFHCDPGSLHLLSVTGDKSVQTLCGTADKSVQIPTHFSNNCCLESLSLDFSRLLDDQKNAPTDVVLKCGSYTVQAHKSILSARSEVFAVMLQCDMLEGKTGQVEVQDIDADVFREFIQYLYSGTVPELTVDKASAFYEAGDKYAVRGLVQRCSSFLVENITPQNACDLLVIADAHSDKEFKDVVVSYILDKKIPLDEEYWPVLCMEHPTLATEVLNRGFKLYFSK